MSNHCDPEKEMISDNGTNFIGANEELQKLKESFMRKGVQWKCVLKLYDQGWQKGYTWYFRQCRQHR